MQNMALSASTCAGISPRHAKSPSRAKSVTCEAKVACKFSKKMPQKALNRVLTLKSSGGGPELPESSGILEKGLICVELRPFYCRERILVPMSYISCLDIREL